MVLAVDIGNSNIVLGCFEGDRVVFEERLSTNRNATELEYTVTIRTLLDLYGLTAASFEGGIVSSVVPGVTQIVRSAVRRVIGKDAIVLGPGTKTGLNIKLENPGSLGSDRVADAVGAIGSYPCPLIIVDMGTATTISVVDRDKQFLGGMIMPGLRVAVDSLASRTSQLPHISLEAPKRVIGSNTVACMQSGLIFGTACSIDGAIDLIEAELGDKCTVVSTGGLANTIIPHCKREIIIDEQLLLKGLMTIYHKNVK